MGRAAVFESSEAPEIYAVVSLSLPIGNLGQTGNPYRKNRAEREREREGDVLEKRLRAPSAAPANYTNDVIAEK